MAHGRNVDFTVHAHAVVSELHLREYVPDVAGILHVQIDLPIQPAVGHVVNHTPKGRNIQCLPAVKAHGQKVIFLRELAGEVYGEGRVAAAVRTNQLAVEIHLGLMGSPQERQTEAFPLPLRGIGNHPLVAGDRLIKTLVKIVEGRFRNRMGQAYFGALVAGHGQVPHFVTVFRAEHPGIVPVNSHSKAPFVSC